MCKAQRRRLLSPSVTLLPFSGKPVRRERALYHSTKRACEPQKGAGYACRTMSGATWAWLRSNPGSVGPTHRTTLPLILLKRRCQALGIGLVPRRHPHSVSRLRHVGTVRHSHLGAARVVPRLSFRVQRARRRSPSRLSLGGAHGPEGSLDVCWTYRGDERPDSRIKCDLSIDYLTADSCVVTLFQCGDSF